MLLKEIKSKINLAQDLLKITRALELVSAVKMRKAQKLALSSRPFTEVVLKVLGELSERPEEIRKSFYFPEKKVKKTLVVVVSSDRGFCGAFNKNKIGRAHV